MNRTLKNNPHLVESIFTLMFETLWVAPYDRRRGNPLLGEFERCAHDAVRLLSAMDLTTASAEQAEAAVHAADRLLASIRRMAEAGLFMPERIAAALAAAGRINDAVKGSRVCETRCK